jgi:hypothetical protein
MRDDQRLTPSAAIRHVALWWHLLSLDAPTIAALWAHLFAQAVNVRVTWIEEVVLAGAVWLTYTADRILDSSLAADPAHLRARHRFAHRQRSRLAVTWVLVLLAVVWLSLTHIDRRLFTAGCGLLGGVLVYLCAVHITPRGLAPDWVKRTGVAAIFSVGTALPAWRHAGDPAILVWPVVAFAVLCFLNCTAIEIWESEPQHGNFGLAMALSAGVLALLCRSPLLPAGRVVLLACTLSVVGLTVLDAARAHLSSEAVRVLADVALLTAALSFGLA